MHREMFPYLLPQVQHQAFLCQALQDSVRRGEVLQAEEGQILQAPCMRQEVHEVVPEETLMCRLFLMLMPMLMQLLLQGEKLYQRCVLQLATGER